MFWGFVGFISRSQFSSAKSEGEKTALFGSFLLLKLFQEFRHFAFVTVEQDYNPFEFAAVEWIVCSYLQSYNKSYMEEEEYNGQGSSEK